MQAITLPIYSGSGKEVDTLKLDGKVFDSVINEASVYQAVNAYRAGTRRGIAATKTRGEVSGGGRKPWKQKGTGRARVGSIRSPLWRHGGVVFGPHPRDFSFRLPEKIKNLALKSALNSKVKENGLIVLDEFKIDKAKTKEALSILLNLKVTPDKTNKRNYRVLLLLDNINADSKLALRNIGFLNLNLAKNTHAFEVMASSKVIITKKGMEDIVKRLHPDRNTLDKTGQENISNGVNK